MQQPSDNVLADETNENPGKVKTELDVVDVNAGSNQLTTETGPNVDAGISRTLRLYLQEAEASEIVKEIEEAEKAEETEKAEEAKSTRAEPVRNETIWTGWAYYESGEACWNDVDSDGGNAFGRFQLDARHSLAGFFKYASERDEDFVGLERYYRKSNNRLKSQRIDELADDWRWLMAIYGERFNRLQIEYASGIFYFPVCDELLKEYGIELNQYGPVLKGTVWSVAVRNGYFLSSIHSVTDTYYDGIDEEEWIRAIYAVEAQRHPDQSRRWGTNQLQAAIETLHSLEKGEIAICDNLDADAWQDLQRVEIISLDKESWELTQKIRKLL